MLAGFYNLFSIIFLFSFSHCLLFSAIENPALIRDKIKFSNQLEILKKSILNKDLERNELILFEQNFEQNIEDWSLDSGWELIDTDYSSATHSVLSSNSNENQNGSYEILTPMYALPNLGENETMHFGFSLKADLPDFDGDEDDILEDYYTVSLLDISEYAWHSTDFNVDNSNGNNFWCADASISGYEDSWIQYLDTESILIGSDGNLSARIYYDIEDDDPPFDVAGSCTNGWDAANIRISTDGGSNWELLEDSSNPYHFNCGYGWIHNNEEYEQGGSLYHLASGWSGKSNGWKFFSASLSQYAGQNIIIRFAFGSDPEWSTEDDASLTGFQVDEIIISDNSGEIYNNNATDVSNVVVSGEVWKDQFHDYGSCLDDRPGCSGWEEYVPGLAYNGNVLMNISDFAGKTIKFRIKAKYDNDHDGGQGEGLFIDDFKIYKLSSGAYFSPWGLSAEAGNGQVSLSWANMNASGNADFIFDNGNFEIENNLYMEEGGGWAGQWFNVIGPSIINNIHLYNSPSNSADTAISIQAYGLFGTLFDTEPLYSTTSSLATGWNQIMVENWNMNNPFVIAYQFNDTFGSAIDLTSTVNYAMFRTGQGAWYYLSSGNFGIRANIDFQGAGVTYKVYKCSGENCYPQGSTIIEGIVENTFVDLNVENNTVYTYWVNALYSDNVETETVETVTVTPLSNSVHEESHDDGSFESTFNAGSGNYSAVKFSANSLGEKIVRFKWFQIGAGGVFYIKIFQDNNGYPDQEIFSAVQASGNVDGWNEKDISSHEINVSGDFWIGTKEFSSTNPFGLDTDSNENNSYKREGSSGEWAAIDGALGYHIYLDSNLCENSDSIGDLTGDGLYNVTDIVALANCVLASNCSNTNNGCSADLDGNGIWNVIDIITLVNCVLASNCNNL